MKDSQEECVTTERAKSLDPYFDENSRNCSQQTLVSTGHKKFHSNRKNVTTKTTNASWITSSLNQKVSRDKVSKPSSPNALEGKRLKKGIETETPSKEATKMLKSMEICGNQEISQPHFRRTDSAMKEMLINDETIPNHQDPEKLEFPSGFSNSDPTGRRQSTDSIGMEYEKGLLWAQRSEYAKEIARTIGPDHPSIPTSLNSMEKSRKKYAGGPVDPNGRCKGRKLVLWHRPRMMEKLLLNIQYECFKAKLRIPWDEIVHRLEPGCSGPSAVQMLNKMRDVLITEGHMIPPAMGNGIQPDPDIRGYVRDTNSDIPGSTRILRWDENYPNASQSLSDSGFVRGSGNYRKVVTKGGAFNKIPRTIEERGYARKVIPEEAYGAASVRIPMTGKNNEKTNQIRPSRGKPRSLWKKPGPKTGSKSRMKSLPESNSQASLWLEGESLDGTNADPEIECAQSTSANTSIRKDPLNVDIGSKDCDCTKHKLDLFCPRQTSSETKSTIKAENLDSESENQFCETGGNITIHIPPSDLSEAHTTLPIYNCNPSGSHPTIGMNMTASYTNSNEENLPETNMQAYLGEYSSKKSHNYQYYKGLHEHGTIQGFLRIHASDTDPCLNGWRFLNPDEITGKINEGNATGHDTELNVSGEFDGLLASDKFLDQFKDNNVSEAVVETFQQQNEMASLFYQGINCEQQMTQPGTGNDVCGNCDNNQSQFCQQGNQDNYYSTEDDNQYLNNQSRKAGEREELDCLNGRILQSPSVMKDLEQEYHFSSGGKIFEDMATESPSKLVVQPKSIISDLFSDFENVGDDELQPSIWQSDFLCEQTDDHQQVRES